MSNTTTQASPIGLHIVHEALKTATNKDEFDVFIAGSGPIGATMARILVDQGFNVVMAEIGDQDTREPGAHKKNEIEYQKDIDRFVRVIQGALSTVSVPRSHTVVPTLNPAAWTPTKPDQMYITNGRNPLQQEFNNLGAEAVTRGVGGMSTHWTCATPEFRKGLERPVLFKEEQKDKDEWDVLYNAARSFIGTSEHEFDESIRHNVVLNALKKAYPERGVQPLPLACHRLAKGSPYVSWHSANRIYGDLFDHPDKSVSGLDGPVKRGFFRLLTNTRCTKLERGTAPDDFDIKLVEVKDLLAERLKPAEAIPTDFYIKAKTYVVAAGAVATPQILANSGLGGEGISSGAEAIPNLGKYITEQPMAFCQVVLLQDLVDDIGQHLDKKPEWWRAAVEHHLAKYKDTDPLPIPFQDPEPQVTIPASEKYPWHTQIHRDAFSYGEVGPQADSRIVVDLRFFGMQPGVKQNRVYFDKNITDAYGMPQPTFEYKPSAAAAVDANRMIADMTEVASKLGGYLPGSYPQFMTPGLALHLGGTVRAGLTAPETVANFNGQVWLFKNLFVAGNGLIPTAFGANPTLTSICFAIRTARKITQDLKANKFSPASDKDAILVTPSDWVAKAVASVMSDEPKAPHTQV